MHASYVKRFYNAFIRHSFVIHVFVRVWIQEDQLKLFVDRLNRFLSDNA